jgi:hypothetical protein
MVVVVMVVPVMGSWSVVLLVVVVSLVGVAEAHRSVGSSGDDGAGNSSFGPHWCRFLRKVREVGCLCVIISLQAAAVPAGNNEAGETNRELGVIVGIRVTGLAWK